MENLRSFLFVFLAMPVMLAWWAEPVKAGPLPPNKVCIRIGSVIPLSRLVLNSLEVYKPDYGMTTPDIDFNNIEEVHNQLAIYVSQLQEQTTAFDVYSITDGYKNEVKVLELKSIAEKYSSEMRFLSVYAMALSDIVSVKALSDIVSAEALSDIVPSTTTQPREEQQLRYIFTDSAIIIRNLQTFLNLWIEKSTSLDCTGLI